MRHVSLVLLCLSALLASSALAVDRPLVGVLDLDGSGAKLSRDEVLDLTGLVRKKALDLLGDRYDIITRENLEDLLRASGKTLEKCMDGACETEIGRKIGAELIVSGSVRKTFGKLSVVLKVHSTDPPRVLGMERTRVDALNELPSAMEVLAGELFLLGKPSPAAAAGGAKPAPAQEPAPPPSYVPDAGADAPLDQRQYFLVEGYGKTAALEMWSRTENDLSKACSKDGQVDDTDMNSPACKAAMAALLADWKELFVACPDEPIVETAMTNIEFSNWGHDVHVLGMLSIAVPREMLCLAARTRAELGTGLKGLHQRPSHDQRRKRLAERHLQPIDVATYLVWNAHDIEGGGTSPNEMRETAQATTLLEGELEEAHYGLRNIFVTSATGTTKGGEALEAIVLTTVPPDPNEADHAYAHQLAFIMSKGDEQKLSELSFGKMPCSPNTAYKTRRLSRCSRVAGVGDIDGDGRTDVLIDDRGSYITEMGGVVLYRSMGSWFGSVEAWLGAWGGG